MFALVVVDGLISNFLMTHGLGREWDPVLQTLVGGENFLLIKVAGAFLSALILWDISPESPACHSSRLCSSYPSFPFLLENRPFPAGMSIVPINYTLWLVF